MEWVIIIVIVVVALAIYNGRKVSFQNTSYLNPKKDVNFKLGIYRTIIKGLSHRGITKKDIGVFYGYALAQTDNQYDKYAVAIYNENGKHIGFAPANYATLHQSILDRGGKVYCCGIIREGDENPDVLLGDVYIDFDKNYWEIKNKELGVRKVYRSPNLKRYSFDVYPEFEKTGKFYGNARVVGTTYRSIAINNGKDEIGVLSAMDDTVYNSIEDFHNGETLAWGYIKKERHTFNNEDTFFGYVFIPIKCSKEKIEKELSYFKDEPIRYTYRI